MSREPRAPGDGIRVKSINFEITIADMARRSERRAWWVASGASAISLILAAGYFYILPLKERVPFLVMADAYQLYSQFYDKLKQLGKNELGYASEASYVNAAAGLAVSARSNGLTRIDHVILSADGKGIFAVEGRMDDPANRWLQVDKAQVAGQSVQISTAQMGLVVQERGAEPAYANEIRVAARR